MSHVYLLVDNKYISETSDVLIVNFIAFQNGNIFKYVSKILRDKVPLPTVSLMLFNSTIILYVPRLKEATATVTELSLIFLSLDCHAHIWSLLQRQNQGCI